MCGCATIHVYPYIVHSYSHTMCMRERERCRRDADSSGRRDADSSDQNIQDHVADKALKYFWKLLTGQEGS